MAKSKESFNKREKEKKRLKQKQEKREKMEQRKANADKDKSFEDMLAYVDEDGNLSSTPPDPTKKKVFELEDIPIGVSRIEEEPEEVQRTGVVAFFNTSKGFGFITDSRSGERVFVHVNQLSEAIYENDTVRFEVANGPRGLNAIKVEKLPKT